ncbi:MAG: lipopolysaccharide biosynthesis protein [Lachnospiraceae bacterium]|nr:lipopolysaccharide biosynthesis protein [Lachnospiraceae bacterium]
MGTASGGSEGQSGLVKSFLDFFYGNFVVLLLGFIQTPILTRLLGRADFGKTGMFEIAVTIIYIFSILGMDQSYIRYYYREGVSRRNLLFSCLLPALGIVSVLSVVYVFFSGQANVFLFGETGTDITLLVIAYTMISVLERYFFLDVRMQQNGKLYSNVNIAQKVLSILIIIGAWHVFGDNFRVGLYAMTLSWGGTTFFLIIRYLKQGRAGEEEGRTKRVPEMELIRYGLPFIAVLLMEWLLSSADRFALRLWSSFEELGLYTSAMRIIVLLLTVKNTFVAYWSPIAMERFETRDIEENRPFFQRIYGTVQILCVFLSSGLIVTRRAVVLILGKDYRGAESMIPFLTLMPVFAILFEITNQSIKFSKKNWYLNAASLFTILCNVAGNALLVPKLGGLGAAAATGCSYLIYFMIGTLAGERCIPVGYPVKKTFFLALVMTAYCAEASFYGAWILDLLGGILLCFTACLMNRDAAKGMIEYGKKFIRSGKKKKTE